MSSGVITPQIVNQLVQLLTQLITLDQTEITQNAALNQQVSDLQAQIAGFQDPTLNANVQAAIQAAVAALPPTTPPATTPPANPTPAPATQAPQSGS